MKFKAIAAICKKRGFLRLIDMPGDGDYISQWVSDGAAAYPIIGLPYMQTEHICAAFEYNDKILEKMRIDHSGVPEGLCFEDFQHGETLLTDESLHIAYAGRVLKPLEVTGGLVFIDTSYLSPLSDIWPVMEFFERRTSAGGTYIAVKAGMLLYAIIMPYDVLDNTFVAKIETLSRKCRKAFDAKAAATTASPSGFAQVKTDPSTGEIVDETEADDEQI